MKNEENTITFDNNDYRGTPNLIEYIARNNIELTEREKQIVDLIQHWIVDYYSSEVEKWLIYEYSNEVEKWIRKDVCPEIENFVKEYVNGNKNAQIEREIKNEN